MTKTILQVLTAVILLSRPAFASDYPVNRWVKVETKNAFRGYTYASPVYCPVRGQILHWGAVRNIYRVPLENRDDVLAFDPDRADWFSDYPTAPGLKPSHSVGQTGIGTSIRGTAEMMKNGRPTPSMVVNAVCYDSKRKQVVYAMKGLMAAYDPVEKTWADMEASTVLYDKKYPGAPPFTARACVTTPLTTRSSCFRTGAVRAIPRTRTGCRRPERSAAISARWYSATGTAHGGA